MTDSSGLRQSNRTFLKLALSAVVFAAICFAADRLANVDNVAEGVGNWCSIVPPVLAIFLAFLTRKVILSLGIAFVTGGLLKYVQADPFAIASWIDGAGLVTTTAVSTVTDIDNIKILCFIPPVFVMIELIMASGGFNGVVLWLLKWIKGSKSAQAQTAVLGILCFIDDYANAIIVGSMMQPITDRFRVSRQKLAFIVDATSAPITGLAIVSTWIAVEVGYFAAVSQEYAFARSGYAMFLDALSFRFYCLFMIIFVFVNIFSGRDFGAMRKAQAAAADAVGGGDGAGLSLKVKGRAANALVPLGGFLLYHVVNLWLDGWGPALLFEGSTAASWAYWQEVIGSSENTTVILARSAVFGVLLAMLCGVASRSLNPGVVLRSVRSGVKRAMIPTCILLLAWSLKGSCDELNTGEFLRTILEGRVSRYAYPALLFVVASLTSFATGTSWGTMAILIPTAIPTAFALDGNTYGITTMISLGAVLDGAIFGDHCSPISDTTIISSVSSNCDLMQHVRTQLPYSLAVAALALVCGYVPAAFGLKWIWSVLLALSAMTALFLLLPKLKLPRHSR